MYTEHFMLQLQNVTKTYKTKAGTVNALDDVSLTFPDTGLVFITGKSGCGKTTLLNVIGGLDGIDGGELIIQDKKFSTFSAKEYDSYRNTFIGFIFQEYNLLPEFTVEKNIKIAMELQGKKANEAEFEKLLQDVEISELKRRTPAELSGGQRQRVAIARALVKEPHIIMADEPTGALDSGTGIQVLDTLKKLSKDKLVIVVSHDREFAEKYADRIIQLVDGKVAQDITFKERSLDTNVNEQENTLVVRDGSILSESEKDLLAEAIKDRKKIEIVEKLSFRDKEPTGEIEHTAGNPVSLKKSKMKFKSAAFLGIKSLAVKPVRLILTILISSLAFAVFALFDTLANFNTVNVLKNTLSTSAAQTVTTTASHIVDFESQDKYGLKVSDQVISDLSKAAKGTVKGIFTLKDETDGEVSQSLSIAELKESDVIIGTKYYSKSISGFIEFNAKEEINQDKTFKDFPYQLISGKYPTLSYRKGAPTEKSLHEVAISSYLADSIFYYLNGKKLGEEEIKTPNDLLEKTLTINEVAYTIVGIIDCGAIPEKYDVLKRSTPGNVTVSALLSDYNAYINAGAQSCLFVGKGFKDEWKKINQLVDTYYIGNANWTFTVVENPASTKRPISQVYNANDYNENNVLLFKEKDSGDVSLADDEVLIHHVNLIHLFQNEINLLPDSNQRADVRMLIRSMAQNNADVNKEILSELRNLLKGGLSSGSIDITLKQRSTKSNELTTTNLKIVGIYFGVGKETYTVAERYKFMMSPALMQRLNIYSQQGDHCKVLFSTAALQSGVDTIVNYVTSETGLSLQLYNNSVLSLIHDNEIMIKQITDLFLYAAIALALLSVFMLYNYISTSIASKKQSVGVLRGLGAGGKDILLTFLSESLIIALINGILAGVFARFGCSFVNSYIVETINVSIYFALFGIRQIAIIALISLLTAIISSALPIIKISKRKPVDLIRRP